MLGKTLLPSCPKLLENGPSAFPDVDSLKWWINDFHTGWCAVSTVRIYFLKKVFKEIYASGGKRILCI